MRITLCGSTRFIEQFHAWNRWLTLQGHAVYSVAGSAKHGWEITDDEKGTLDLVHLDKILNSEAILVIDCLRMPDQYKYNHDIVEHDWELLTEVYTGQSTKREIKWAKLKGKYVMYTNSFSPSDIQ